MRIPLVLRYISPSRPPEKRYAYVVTRRRDRDGWHYTPYSGPYAADILCDIGGFTPIGMWYRTCYTLWRKHA